MNTRLMNRSIKFLAASCVLSLILAGCVPIPPAIAPADLPAATPAPASPPAPTPTQAAGAYWPTEGWRTSTPEAQGIDSAQLADMVDEINERKINVHSLLVIRNGYLVSENYFGGRTAGDRQEIQSAVKSFIGTLVGIALDKGYLKGTDQRVLDFFADRQVGSLDERKQAITVEDLLTMRSGLEYVDPQDLERLKASPDWVQDLLDRRMVDEPGARWNYCTGCSYLLAAIVEKTTGVNTFDFAAETLMKPLGITDYKISGKATGDPAVGWGFNITPRDMAKLGYLFLRKGQWDGQQIVSADWVEKATRKHADVPVNAHFGYGYHWFTVPEMRGYAALGDLGQIILVIPEDDLIVVTTAYTEQSLFELFEKYILPAVR